jgi:hypothetical protein
VTSFVQMPADLACFLRAAELAREILEGFSIEDVTCVEQAWQVDDLDHASFGWVVALSDGRRFYLEYTMDDAEAGRPEDLDAAALSSGQARPDLDNEVQWYDPVHINRHLGLAV